jgi:hypothetical protein
MATQEGHTGAQRDPDGNMRCRPASVPYPSNVLGVNVPAPKTPALGHCPQHGAKVAIVQVDGEAVCYRCWLDATGS